MMGSPMNFVQVILMIWITINCINPSKDNRNSTNEAKSASDGDDPILA